MSIAPFVLAALILLAAHFRDVRQDRREVGIRAEHEAERTEWTRERAELLTRVQAPNLIPAPRTAAAPPVEDAPEPDEEHLVGTIAVGVSA